MNRPAAPFKRISIALSVCIAFALCANRAQAHEVYGVLVHDGAQLVLSNYLGVTDYGALSAHTGVANPTYHITWYDQDQLELDLFGVTGHYLVVTVADTTILKAETFPNQFDVRLTGRAAGHTTIRFGFNYFSTPEFTSVPLDVEVLPTVGVGPDASAASVRLSAVTNPARGAARVAYSTRGSGLHRVDVVDVQGRVRQRVDVQVGSPGGHEMTLDVSALDPGLYFLRLSGAGGVSAARFVVAR